MTHKLTDRLARELSALVALVEDISEADMDRQFGDGWTVRDILTHLLNAEEDHCRVISVIAKGEADRLPTELDLAQHNAARLEERGNLPKGELLAALAAQRARTEALFNRLTPGQKALEGRHPALGHVSVEKIFRIIGIHMKMHTQEIAEALK